MRSRSLSEVEARVVLSMEAAGQEEASLEDIGRLATVSPGFARKLAHQLTEKGWLQRVRRGVYLLNPSAHGADAVPDTDPLRAGSHLVRPYYFGFSTAAELQGLLPQASRTYYVVTPTRTRVRVRHAARFRVVHAERRRFFGTRTILRRGVHLTVSDRERTIMDCLARPEFSGGLPGVVRMLESAGADLDWDRLARYLLRLGNRTLAARVGFLGDLLGPPLRPPSAWTRRFRPSANAPYALLGSPATYGRAGPRDERWHLVRNVSEAQLRSEIEVR